MVITLRMLQMDLCSHVTEVPQLVLQASRLTQDPYCSRHLLSTTAPTRRQAQRQRLQLPLRWP